MAKRRYVALILCAGVFALIATGEDSCSESVDKANKAADDLEKATSNNPELNKQISGIPLGSSIEQVESQLGKPDNRQEFNTSLGKDESLYYGQWQLNFTDGELDSKNKY